MDNKNYDQFMCNIVKYSTLLVNITYIIVKINYYSDFLNIAFNQCATPYLTIIGKMDSHNTDYTYICCNYLDLNPNIDITFASYNIIEHDYREQVIFEHNKMLFSSNFSKFLCPNTGIVWRKNIHNLIGPFTNSNTICLIRKYLQQCLKRHINISCCHAEPLYTISLNVPIDLVNDPIDLVNDPIDLVNEPIL